MNVLRLCATRRSVAAARSYCTAPGEPVTKAPDAGSEAPAKEKVKKDDKGPLPLVKAPRKPVRNLIKSILLARTMPMLQRHLRQLQELSTQAPPRVVEKSLLMLLQQEDDDEAFAQAKELLKMMVAPTKRKRQADFAKVDILRGYGLRKTITKLPRKRLIELIPALNEPLMITALTTLFMRVPVEEWAAQNELLVGITNAEGANVTEADVIHGRMSASILMKDFARFVEDYQTLEVAMPRSLKLLIDACAAQAADNPDACGQFLALAEQALEQSNNDPLCVSAFQTFKDRQVARKSEVEPANKEPASTNASSA